MQTVANFFSLGKGRVGLASSIRAMISVKLMSVLGCHLLVNDIFASSMLNLKGFEQKFDKRKLTVFQNLQKSPLALF